MGQPHRLLFARHYGCCIDLCQHHRGCHQMPSAELFKTLYASGDRCAGLRGRHESIMHGEMPHRPDLHDSAVKRLLRLLSAHQIIAQQMPELKRKTCDVVGRHVSERFYIEVKVRRPPLPGSYTFERGPRSSIRKILDEGAKQLLAMPDQDSTLRVLWVVTDLEDDDEFEVTCLIHTVYGIQTVSAIRGTVEINRDCFFYHPSAFGKWKQLDLLVIESNRGLVFCLNPLSSQYRRLRKSRFFKLPKRLLGVIDPQELEREGCCWIAEAGDSEEARAKATLRAYRFDSLTPVREVLHTSCSGPTRIPIKRLLA
jgi:hypothetical protein